MSCAFACIEGLFAVTVAIDFTHTFIHSIGKAGNPDTMNGVTLTPGKEMIVGPTTDVIAGEKMIVTAGGVDTHIHFICPQQCDEAIASGVTTMYGGGTGPSAGTSATSKSYIQLYLLILTPVLLTSAIMILQHALLDRDI